MGMQEFFEQSSHVFASPKIAARLEPEGSYPP